MRLRCQLGSLGSSEILLGRECRRAIADALHSAGRPTFVLADRGVGELDGLLSTLPTTGHLILDGGEGCKRLDVLGRVLEALSRSSIDRSGRVLVVGGGAVGDLGGLAASLYLRGIELWQVPTTLLAMVDSSVGGKTAIDLPGGKNLAGTFWPAARVFVDAGFCQTLPEQQLRAGLGEVLKIALGLDAELFEFCEHNGAALLGGDLDALETAIAHCLRQKIAIVERDPTERGERRLLNLGHTLAHAIEAESGFETLHGYAVGLGLRHVVDLAVGRGRLGEDDAARARALLQTFGFGFGEAPIAPDRAEPWIRRDKKCSGGVLHAVLPTGIGQSAIEALTVEEFLEPLGSPRRPD